MIFVLRLILTHVILTFIRALSQIDIRIYVLRTLVISARNRAKRSCTPTNRTDSCHPQSKLVTESQILKDSGTWLNIIYDVFWTENRDRGARQNKRTGSSCELDGSRDVEVYTRPVPSSGRVWEAWECVVTNSYLFKETPAYNIIWNWSIGKPEGAVVSLAFSVSLP